MGDVTVAMTNGNKIILNVSPNHVLFYYTLGWIYL